MEAESQGIIVNHVDDFYSGTWAESCEWCGVGSLVLRQMMTHHRQQGQMAHKPRDLKKGAKQPVHMLLCAIQLHTPAQCKH